MDLTTTEKYALAVLGTYGKLSALQKKDRAVPLAASCVWDMMQAGAVAVDEKGKLRVTAPLPEAISYCAPVYARLEKKPIKLERVPLDRVWTGKRIKAMVKNIADDLIGKSLLVVEQPDNLKKAKLCHVDTAVIAEDLETVRDLGRAGGPGQTDLAVLLLVGGSAKKMLNKQEFAALKKGIKRVDSDFRAYVMNAVKVYQGVKTMFLVAAATSGAGQ